MTEQIEIKGGAGEFEAAVIAVVIDRIAREDAAARQLRGGAKPGLPAWVRAVRKDDPGTPRQPILPT